MALPPLNQTLWMLLVASLTIGAAWLGLLLTADQNGFWDKRSDVPLAEALALIARALKPMEPRR